MAWDLQWGQQLDFLKHIEETTGDVPPALLNKPKLTNWVAQYWNAYMILSAGRPVSMGGACPIPISEMEAYCRMFGVGDIDERERFVMMIRALDSVYMKDQSDKREAERKKHG